LTAHVEHGPEGADDARSSALVEHGDAVKPITSLEQLDGLAHPELWASDDEYKQFLADVYVSRRASTG
jgi:hypothetical protein